MDDPEFVEGLRAARRGEGGGLTVWWRMQCWERLREERTRGLALAMAFLVVVGIPRRLARVIAEMAGIP